MGCAAGSVGLAVVLSAATAAAHGRPSPGGPGGSSTDRTAQVRQAVQGGKARTVILFIGHGMGDSEITIARNYARGTAGRLAMDTLPLTGEPPTR